MILYWIYVGLLLVLSTSSANPYIGKSDNGKSFRNKPVLTNHDLNVAVKVAEDIISKWQRLELNLVGSGIEVQEKTPSHGQFIDSYPSAEALTFGKYALIANRASLYLIQKHCQQSNIYLVDCLKTISQMSLSATPLGEKCRTQFNVVNCSEPQTYRTFDGSCNHIQHPTRGKSLTSYTRLISPVYSDGIKEPKRSVSRKPLPSPRSISNILIPDLDKPEKATTLAFVQWTQFISDDLFHTPVSKMVHTGGAIECCNRNGKNLTPRYLHPKCQPIVISDKDPDYSSHRTICMNYVRSLTSLKDDCSFGPADQMNQATHYLDGSMIYGSTPTDAASLRSMVNGKLVTTMNDKKELLPISDAPEDGCQAGEEDICFKSGDSRVNMHPHHTAMYTIWVREHNRLATLLSKVNPHWDDETIFQEARKIVIAQIQHITYKYWVPYTLGYEVTIKSNLDIKNRGFSQFFSEEVNPEISNSFATTGLRFINSMFQSQLRLYDDQGLQNGSLSLKDHFNKPSVLKKPGVFEGLLRGLGFEASQKMDSSFVKDVTNFLFRGSSPMGQDVVSLDIQRERDHGLPGYNAFRKYCNLPSNDKFDTFLDTIPQSHLNKIKLMYNHPDDVDLIVGAISETPSPGSLVGPVFQCIIREQMIRTRSGDRFFYDIGGKPHSFKQSQIDEIKKVTLSRIFCDNVDNLNKMQLNVFNVPSSKNPLVSCNDYTALPKINLELWRTRPIK